MELASTEQQAAWLKSLSGEIGFPIEGSVETEYCEMLF